MNDFKVIANYDKEAKVLYINFYDPPKKADDSVRFGPTIFRYDEEGELIGFTVLDVEFAVTHKPRTEVN